VQSKTVRARAGPPGNQLSQAANSKAKSLLACLAAGVLLPHYRCRLGDHLASVIQTMACNPVWCTGAQTQPEKHCQGPIAASTTNPWHPFAPPPNSLHPIQPFTPHPTLCTSPNPFPDQPTFYQTRRVQKNSSIALCCGLKLLVSELLAYPPTHPVSLQQIPVLQPMQIACVHGVKQETTHVVGPQSLMATKEEL
jgi:hypothetical protein